MTIENFRLVVFRALARHLSFSRAAEELLLTQPAVTQQIKALEEEFGIPLFHRGGGRISLTPSGAALLPFAERFKALNEQAFAAVANAHGQQAGELAVGASQTIAQYLLPTFLAGFLQRNPRLRVTARSGNTDQMLAALVSGDIQLALLEGPDQGTDVHIEPFMEDHMVLVVPAGHEWAGQKITPDQLRSQPLLTREFGSGSRRIVEQALASAGLKTKDLSIRMQLDSTEGLLNAVEAGLGVTFVSRWAVRNQLALGTLKLARIDGLKLSRSSRWLTPPGRSHREASPPSAPSCMALPQLSLRDAHPNRRHSEVLRKAARLAVCVQKNPENRCGKKDGDKLQKRHRHPSKCLLTRLPH